MKVWEELLSPNQQRWHRQLDVLDKFFLCHLTSRYSMANTKPKKKRGYTTRYKSLGYWHISS